MNSDDYFRMLMREIFGSTPAGALCFPPVPIWEPKDFYFWLGAEAEELGDEH
jgi:hypothetical protein